MVTTNTDEAQKQFTGSAEAVEGALRQLMEVSSLAQILMGKVSFLNLQMSKIAKARDDAIATATEQSRQTKMVEARLGGMKDELDSFKQKESTDRGMEVIYCKAAFTEGVINNLADGLRRDTFDSYANMRHNVDQSFVVVVKLLKKMPDHEAMDLQQGDRDALRIAGGGVQKLFAATTEVADRRLTLIAGHPKCDELAGPGSSFAHSANLEPRQSWTRATFDSGGGPMSHTPQAQRLLLVVQWILAIIVVNAS